MAAKAKMAKRKSYGLAEAKARLSEVVQKAQTDGPQQITYRGRPAVYVVSAEEWVKKRKPKQNLWEFLRDSPLRGSGIDLERIRDYPRPVDL
jgi:prevent-host-death family protein